MMNETKEKSVPASTLSALFDCSDRALRDLADKGIIKKIGRGRYAFDQSIRGYVRHLRSVASGRGDSSETLTAARIRLAQAKAQEAETKNRIASGEMVAAADVERTWSNSYSIIRRVIMGLPARIASDLSLTRADAARIDDMVRDALNEAADDIGADRQDGDTPAKAH
jgi:phage terminase Nu1 subunit (DNA packaging protein)